MMTQHTMVLEKQLSAASTEVPAQTSRRPEELPVEHMPAGNEPLLREALGATLRDYRSQTGFTLRELASLSSVSPGYLSELERGCKEVSSELLASVCHAMGVSVATVIIEAASMMALDAAAAELTATISR